MLNLANVIKGAAATLATLGNYVTATTSAAGDTTLSFDATGTGLPGVAFAVLKGVTITVAQLLTDNALSVGAVPVVVTPATPHVDTYTFAATGSQTVKVDGFSANEGAEQFVGFNPTGGDVLNLANVIKGTAATLATLGNYVTATTSAAGDTTLSFDPTGAGLPGTAFAVLKGVTITVAQLLTDNALSLGATAPVVVTPATLPFDTITFAAAGNQTVTVDAISTKEGAQQFLGFNPTGGDVLNLASLVSGGTATLATLGGFITASTSATGDTTLYYDPTGAGLQGAAFAVLKGVSISVAQLLADNALSLTATATTSVSGAHVNLVQNNAVLTYGAGNYDISVKGTGESITLGAGNSEVSGPTGSSTVTIGDGRQEVLLTGAGNIVTVGNNTTTGTTEIFAGAGLDHVTAGNGSVYIVGSGNSDVVTVGSGNDTIVETARNGLASVGLNSVTLGLGNDKVFLGGNGNTVVLGAGIDTVYGGAGGDSFVVNAAGGTDTIGNFTLTNGDALNLTQILAGVSLAHDLSNLGSFVALTSVADASVSSGFDTSLTITGASSTAHVTLLNTGSVTLTSLVASNSLVLPPH